VKTKVAMPGVKELLLNLSMASWKNLSKFTEKDERQIIYYMFKKQVSQIYSVVV
jgi:hypothetical protein